MTLGICLRLNTAQGVCRHGGTGFETRIRKRNNGHTEISPSANVTESTTVASRAAFAGLAEV
jgi:hypothetical protein